MVPRKNLIKVTKGKRQIYATSKTGAIKALGQEIKKVTFKGDPYVASISNVKQLKRGGYGEVKVYSADITIYRKKKKV